MQQLSIASLFYGVRKKFWAVFILSCLAFLGVLVSVQNLNSARLKNQQPVIDSTLRNKKPYADTEDTNKAIKEHNAQAIKIVIQNVTQVAHSVVSNVTTPAGVPMILHFVYKDTNLLIQYRTAIETCTRLNANWTVMLWTDDSVRTFITREFPQCQAVFYAFPYKIQRADAIRYLILYQFGGVYMDLDMHCHQPLLVSLSNISCFLDKEREHQSRFEHAAPFLAMNSAMGCRPGHPFFKKVLEFVFHPDRLKIAEPFPRNIFMTTGPFALTDVYKEWAAAKSQPPVTVLNETYFSPWISTDAALYNICRMLLKSLDRNITKLTVREKSCLELEALGFEKSDSAFVTNLTVAIHKFTHLGYGEQNATRFHILKEFPRVLLYENTTGSV